MMLNNCSSSTRMLLLILAFRSFIESGDAFTAIATKQPYRGQLTTTMLDARKSVGSKNSKTTTTTTAATRNDRAGSGFGVAAANGSNNKNSAAATGGSSSSNHKNKLRSVSSNHAGAGSKPLRQAALAFDRIRKEHGVEACRDVYIRSPLNSATTFWYVGKVAFEPNSNKNHDGGVAACLSQKRLILEYSKLQLRPSNLGGKYAATLELWLAPGDSEMDVVQNKVVLQPAKGSASDLPDDFTVDTVGFNPEIYVGDELTKGGLRVERSPEGHPVKPVFDVNQSA